MSHSAGSGDRLARGARSASYLADETGGVSQEKWNDIFDGFDPEAFKTSSPTDPDAKKADSYGNIVKDGEVPEETSVVIETKTENDLG
jgi:hypothetical protein